MSEQSEVRITIRMPKQIHTDLLKLAERDFRSLNTEILYALHLFIERNGTVNLA